ncbi:MAG: lysophospholipid acyltransferase family protein [Gemmataceae bacterium]|nr:lysophospholipid acyltransferase family protein [Gemmataceae bacterium]
MGEKKRSRMVDFLVYATVRVVVCLVQAMSFESALSFAEFLARLAYRVNKRHRLVAEENLRKAFPGQFTDAQIDVMVRNTYRHWCRVLIEILFIPRRLHLTNYKKHISLSDPPLITDALLSGRPLLVVTGHFGNWEMAGYALGMFGFETYAIARALDNPHLDAFLRRFREHTGQKILAKQGDFDRIQDVLRDGGVLATLADQDAGQRGLFVDFFGRPASTHKAVALMAIEHNVPMIVTGTPRLEGSYVVCATRLIDPANYERSPDAVKEITQQFTSDLEHLVRLAPEQYFWLHRRWKHQPQPRKKKAKPSPSPVAETP